MCQIFAQNIFSGVSAYDITCNCDITDSPFLENMASLKRLLKLGKKSKHERKVNFSSNYSSNFLLIIFSSDISNLLGIFMCLFKFRICEHLDINLFKDEENDKISAESAPVQRTSGGESTNSPVPSGSYSLIIDAEYVFISQVQLLF